MSGEPTCVFIKKRRRAATRTKEDSSSGDDDVRIVKKKERVESNPLIQQTAYFAGKRKTGVDEESDDDLTSVTFKADYNTTQNGPNDQRATAALEIDTETSHDAQALFIKSQEINKAVKSNQDKVYRGLNNYAQYLEKKDTVMGNAASGFNRKGPMRAPAHLRATVRWDYQPDICKDYKETGFCSFGDSCKFLHDRSDYKHGWQLEQEFAEGTYGLEGNDDRYEIKSDKDEDDDFHLPLKCIICRGDFKDPVVTNCKHFFCSACALKRLKKTTRCYACTEDTKGVFKMARDLLSRIAAIKEKQKHRGQVEGDEDGIEEGEGNHEDHHGDGCCSHSHSVTNAHGEHYISSSDLKDESDTDDRKESKPTTTFPTLTRLEGAKPEAVEDCDTSEEELD
ncbi:hypothetical protein TSMEX_006780 [Taenia solium]|eukprot:TsM_001089700 transcript=TsM_001089700 gene=TsM_001089700